MMSKQKPLQKTPAPAAPQELPNPNPNPNPNSNPKPTDEAIAQRAYLLYLARGGSNGMDVEDWLEAERVLTQESAEAAGPGVANSGYPSPDDGRI